MRSLWAVEGDLHLYRLHHPADGLFLGQTGESHSDAGDASGDGTSHHSDVDALLLETMQTDPSLTGSGFDAYPVMVLSRYL